MRASNNMILTQPFPYYGAITRRLQFPAIAGAIVFLLLYLFRPFGLSRVQTDWFLLHALLYGLTTFALYVLNALLLPRLFPKKFNEKSWTVGLEIASTCWQITTISFANLVISSALYGNPISFESTLRFLGFTFAIGIFPVSFIILVKYLMLLSKNQSIAERTTKALSSYEPDHEVEFVMITIRGDYQKEELSFPLQSLRYISAADNYIRVWYMDDDKLTSSMLRSSLKKVQETLSGHAQLFRCHRTYLVNLDAVVHVSGNAQGLKLILQDTEELIPVSRSLHSQLNALLRSPSGGVIHP
ncbi:MAG: LytTR family transcriptional regulator [Chitinophagaceae bacterium]|nr:MAG: LytTR family transcriptional regulator [Chitinophagaceae bacterium]